MINIHPAKVLLDGWCPKGKEQFLFFKCAECDATYDLHVQTLMETGVAKCPLCQAHHHMSVVEVRNAMARVKKMREGTA